MRTVTAGTSRATSDERRTIVRGVGWNGYQALLAKSSDRSVRLTYDRGDVEIMAPLPKHERKKSLLGQFVRILAKEFRIPVIPMGSTTWNREDVDKGLEADESFYLGNLERIRDPDDADLDVNPPPDLAIEIEITRSVLDRLGIYGALRVPEVWRFDGKSLRVLLRQNDGSYQESQTSAVFPEVPMNEVARFAANDQIGDENAYVDTFLAWLRQDVLPKTRGRTET